MATKTQSSKITRLTGADLREFTNRNKRVVIDFWAEWCEPCKAMQPKFDKLAETHDRIAFASLNIDSFPDTADAFGVRSIPTFLCFKDGQVVDTVLGASPAALTKAVKAMED
jgi:thioredoxin 1